MSLAEDFKPQSNELALSDYDVNGVWYLHLETYVGQKALYRFRNADTPKGCFEHKYSDISKAVFDSEVAKQSSFSKIYQ